jgi:hypothetical protein
MSSYLVYFTAPDLSLIGQFIDEYTDLQVVLRFNGVDTMVLTAPASPELSALAQPGNRLEVLRDDGDGWTYLTGGPIEKPGDQDWSADGGATADPGQIVIYAADDRAELAKRRTYPTPGNDFEHQTVTGKRTFTATNAEVAMRALVNEQAGPGALTNRKVANLVLGTLASVGSNVTYSSRFNLLTDDLRAIARAGGGLGYRIVRTAAPALAFEVFVPADRSGTVRYSRALGNLRAYSYRSAAPTATVALVGGDGTGTSRVFKEVANSAALAAGWTRNEVFVADDTTDTTELTQNGENALAEAGETAQLVATAIDNSDQRFGRDYGLGDVVGVEIDGVGFITDVVTAVTITVATGGTAAGETVQPQIGTGDPFTDSATLRLLRRLDQRLGRLERV